MNDMIFQKMIYNDIQLELFASFDRYQDVKKCWRKENGKWILKDMEFVEQWNTKNYEELVVSLRETLKSGGAVWGVFESGNLVGFASLENCLFGSRKQYLQLSSLHVSYSARGKGIGKKLFAAVCEEAKKRNVQKLYISAQSSEETQHFYRAVGCVEALEYNAKLVAEEPCDCQLEYALFSEKLPM